MYEYKAKVINVVDGDTFDLDVDLGFNIHNFIRVRLLGIDTPEKFGEEKELGLICKNIAEYYYLNKTVIIRSEKEENDVDTDSFGRYLVWLREINDSFSIDELYNDLGINKLAVNYSKEEVRKCGKELERIYEQTK